MAYSKKEIKKLATMFRDGLTNKEVGESLGWGKKGSQKAYYVRNQFALGYYNHMLATIGDKSLIDYQREMAKLKGGEFIVNADDVIKAPTVKTKDTQEDDLEALSSLQNVSLSSMAKRLRNAQRTNTELRRIQRELYDKEAKAEVDKGWYKEVMDSLASKLSKEDVAPTLPYVQGTYDPQYKECTMEVLFSDLQLGKISENWNTEQALVSLDYYGRELVKLVDKYLPERIIFASLGDICECSQKHGLQSAYSTDMGDPEQLATAITAIWKHVLHPLIATGVPIDIVGVQGNHMSGSVNGADMYKPGRYGYDYVMYTAWQQFVSVMGASSQVGFNIPEGNFATYDIYGMLTVAEHGYECKGSSEVAMTALRNKRADNLQQYVHRLVVGDMHHMCNYDNGRLQVNGAFFGQAYDAIEYSGIKGFHATPIQLVNIHAPVTEDKASKNTVVETHAIQISKSYK